MPRTTTEIHLTTNLGDSDFQARAADDIRDLLDNLAVMWADRKDADRRKLIAHLERHGMPPSAAELAVEQYHRSVRLLIDALSTTARSAKVVGDSHANMIGALNRHLRNTGLSSPVTGLPL